MANERTILCGSVSRNALPVSEPRPVCLRRWQPGRNVNLVIGDLHRALWRQIPIEFEDLIDIAVYVYCADQAITRGGAGVEDFGANWRRRLFFRIPVRNPDLWRTERMGQLLASTLSFLSEDEYFFEFEPLRRSESFQKSFQFSADADRADIEEVMLFSGGLDSLAGAIQEAVIDRRRVALVNHRSTQKLSSRHRRLVRQLRGHAPHAPPVHIPIVINKAKKLGQEPTQRSRSFLYAALGGTIAHMLGLSRVRFYENGVVSLNLPPSPQVVGARATRTTHPRVLRGFEALLTELAGKRFQVENRFLWKTKTDVVRLIADAGCGDLIGHSSSCTRTWETTLQHPHCGTCSQCIDRRFAVLAAGQADADPGHAYAVDLLTGERPDGQPRTMLAAYLDLATEITRMEALQFFQTFGEAARVLRHVEGSADGTAMNVFDLHQRHARQVNSVIDRAIAEHATAIRERTLPASSLVRLVCDASAASPPTDLQPLQDMPDRNGQTAWGDNVFRWNGKVWDVRFAGGKSFVLLRSRGAAYLNILLANPGQAFSAVDLAFRVTQRPELYALGDAGQALDQEAVTAYRARLLDLEEEVEEAKENHDPVRQEKLQGEIEQLRSEVRRAYSKNGHVRKAADDRERVRKAVRAAIRRAIADIHDDDVRLAAHLGSERLRCGLNPCYMPEDGVEWQTIEERKYSTAAPLQEK